MWLKGTDCNEDHVITCEDYVLIHRYGPDGCKNYLERDNATDFSRHQTCLHTMLVSQQISWSNLSPVFSFQLRSTASLQRAEEITGKATYDQTVGFTLNEKPDFQALYICSSKANGVQYSWAPLDTSLRVPAELHLSNVPGKKSSLLCSTKTEKLESLELTMAPCPSRIQCDLKIRPTYVTWKLLTI